MSNIINLFDKKKLYHINKEKRIKKQKEKLDLVFNSSIEKRVLLLLDFWPNGLPKIALRDERMSESLYNEYLLTFLKNDMLKSGLSSDFNPEEEVIQELSNERFLQYENKLKDFFNLICENTTGELTILVNTLNPLTYDHLPKNWNEENDEVYDFLSANCEFKRNYVENYHILSIIACALHLEGEVFIMEKTNLSFEHNNQWINKEKVFGYSIINNGFYPLKDDEVKDLLEFDLQEHNLKYKYIDAPSVNNKKKFKL